MVGEVRIWERGNCYCNEFYERRIYFQVLNKWVESMAFKNTTERGFLLLPFKKMFSILIRLFLFFFYYCFDLLDYFSGCRESEEIILICIPFLLWTGNVICPDRLKANKKIEGYIYQYENDTVKIIIKQKDTLIYCFGIK